MDLPDLAAAIQARACELEARAARWRALAQLLAAPADNLYPSPADEPAADGLSGAPVRSDRPESPA